MPVSLDKSTETVFTPEAVAALKRLKLALLHPVEADGGTFPGGVVNVSRYLATDFRRELRRAEETIADVLPALTPADFRSLCNGDHAVRAEVGRFRDGYTFADVSELRSADEESETWEIVNAGSRFEVRELPRYEAREVGGPGNQPGWYVHDNADNGQANDFDAIEALGFGEVAALNQEQARAVAEHLLNDTPDCDRVMYVVWDTDNDRDAREGDKYDAFHDHDTYDTEEEDDARRACDAANLENYRANANGWPFAWNTAAEVSRFEIDAFAAAGFVIARHEPSGTLYAGIDGGGYDFLEAHWSRVYLARMLPNAALRDFARSAGETPCIYVPTDNGLRRVVSPE